VRELKASGQSDIQVLGLAAGGSQLDLLAQQVVEFSPCAVAVACTSAAAKLPDLLKHYGVGQRQPQIISGPDAAAELVRSLAMGQEGTVLNGITGSVGLAATLATLADGARLALANKESLVVGGALVKQALAYPGQVVPVDSEHSAIAQALLSGRHEKGLTSPVVSGYSEVSRLILTASGGPFRGKKREQLSQVTAAQALAHPTWSMGPVVTVNSSTLVNKGLELIEAHLLFDVDASDIDVVVHPQSIVHSMVEFVDGATIAQASPPDMRLPIALGMTWPHRPCLVGKLTKPTDFTKVSSWDFEPVDNQTFPALQLARHAVSASPTHPAVFNAANEQAVDAFLKGALNWVDIVDIDIAVVNEHEGVSAPSLDDVLAVDRWARARADELIAAKG
jgi:1-deoxy-D-xylulose 5-phosphate reductoisomerase